MKIAADGWCPVTGFWQIFLGPLDRPVRTFYLKVAEGSPLANISSTVVRKRCSPMFQSNTGTDSLFLRLDEGLPINDLIPEESPEVYDTRHHQSSSLTLLSHESKFNSGHGRVPK